MPDSLYESRGRGFKSLWAHVLCWAAGFAAIGGLRQLIIGTFGADARSNPLGAPCYLMVGFVMSGGLRPHPSFARGDGHGQIPLGAFTPLVPRIGRDLSRSFEVNAVRGADFACKSRISVPSAAPRGKQILWAHECFPLERETFGGLEHSTLENGECSQCGLFSIALLPRYDRNTVLIRPIRP